MSNKINVCWALPSNIVRKFTTLNIWWTCLRTPFGRTFWFLPNKQDTPTISNVSAFFYFYLHKSLHSVFHSFPLIKFLWKRNKRRYTVYVASGKRKKKIECGKSCFSLGNCRLRFLDIASQKTPKSKFKLKNRKLHGKCVVKQARSRYRFMILCFLTL